jgi:hypothetical protein
MYDFLSMFSRGCQTNVSTKQLRESVAQALSDQPEFTSRIGRSSAPEGEVRV